MPAFFRLHPVEKRNLIGVFRIDHKIIHIVPQRLVHLLCHCGKFPQGVRHRAAENHERAVAAYHPGLQLLKINRITRISACLQLLHLMHHAVPVWMRQLFIAATDKENIPVDPGFFSLKLFFFFCPRKVPFRTPSQTADSFFCNSFF